jgi:hypothetical protein
MPKRRMWIAQRKRTTLRVMKSAVIPQICVEPELRAKRESVLRPGKTLSEFVEACVRNAAELQRMQTSFHERGRAAWEHYQSTGESVPTDEILAELQARRKQLGE